MDVCVLDRRTKTTVTDDPLMQALLNLFHGPDGTITELLDEMRQHLNESPEVYMSHSGLVTDWKVSNKLPPASRPNCTYLVEVDGEITDQKICDVATSLHLWPCLRALPDGSFDGSPEDYEIVAKEQTLVTPLAMMR